MTHIAEPIERHTIAVLVDNEAGVLARVIGLFSGRGYNIESLTVAEVDNREQLSRITIVTTGTKMIVEQIKNQLRRLVPVHKVSDLTIEGAHVSRELALVKVASTGEKRVEALRIADIFRANVIDATNESFVFEVVGATDKVDAFIKLMEPLGLVDVSRTGVVAIARGPAALQDISFIAGNGPHGVPCGPFSFPGTSRQRVLCQRLSSASDPSHRLAVGSQPLPSGGGWLRAPARWRCRGRRDNGHI